MHCYLDGEEERTYEKIAVAERCTEWSRKKWEVQVMEWNRIYKYGGGIFTSAVLLRLWCR